MYVTENDAVELDCPFAHNFNAGDPHSRITSPKNTPEDKLTWRNPKCVGSRCMAWDWVDNETFGIGGALSHGFESPPRDFFANNPDEVVTEWFTSRGWTRQPKYAANSVAGWSRKNLTRRGQCSRTVNISE